MTIKFKRDLTSTLFFCKSFKGSKFISGKDYKTSKLVIVLSGIRLDVNF